MRRDLVIFGTGAFADVLTTYLEQDSGHRVAAYTVDAEHLTSSRFRGRPVLAFDEVAREFPPASHRMMVAVGVQKVNRLRAARVAAAEAKGYELASFVSPRAPVPTGLAVGPNTVIMEESLIEPGVTIGADTIVWPTTRIGYGSRVGDHCWLVCAALGAEVTVEDFAFLGLNATVAAGLHVGRGAVVGAGAVLLEDAADDAVYRAARARPSTVPAQRLPRL